MLNVLHGAEAKGFSGAADAAGDAAEAASAAVAEAAEDPPSKARGLVLDAEGGIKEIDLEPDPVWQDPNAGQAEGKEGAAEGAAAQSDGEKMQSDWLLNQDWSLELGLLNQDWSFVHLSPTLLLGVGRAGSDWAPQQCDSGRRGNQNQYPNARANNYVMLCTTAQETEVGV